MPRIEKTFTIDAPVETVFGRIKDPMVNLEIAPVISEVRDISGEGLGMRFTMAADFLGTKLDLECEYTEYVPNQGFAFHWTGATLDATTSYALEPEAEGTRCNLACEFTVSAPLLGKFEEPVVGELLSQNYDLISANIKALIEAENPSS